MNLNSITHSKPFINSIAAVAGIAALGGGLFVAEPGRAEADLPTGESINFGINEALEDVKRFSDELTDLCGSGWLAKMDIALAADVMKQECAKPERSEEESFQIEADKYVNQILGLPMQESVETGGMSGSRIVMAYGDQGMLQAATLNKYGMRPEDNPTFDQITKVATRASLADGRTITMLLIRDAETGKWQPTLPDQNVMHVLLDPADPIVEPVPTTEPTPTTIVELPDGQVTQTYNVAPFAPELSSLNNQQPPVFVQSPPSISTVRSYMEAVNCLILDNCNPLEKLRADISKIPVPFAFTEPNTSLDVNTGK